MAIAPTRLMTAEEFYDFCHLPKNRDRHFELDEGEVVEMAQPGERHGFVCGNVARHLGNYVYQRRRGYVCSNDTGVVWKRDPDTVRGPDVLLYDKLMRYDDLNPRYAEHVPTLVVEVFSPSDRYTKALRRINLFLKRGVKMAWILDPEERTLTVLVPNQLPQPLDETEELTGGTVLPGFRCTVAELFQLPGGSGPTPRTSSTAPAPAGGKRPRKPRASGR